MTAVLMGFPCLSAARDPVGETRDPGRLCGMGGDFAAVGGSIRRVHAVYPEPAERFGFPLADLVTGPGECGEVGLARPARVLLDEVAEGAGGEVRRGDTGADVAARPAEAGGAVEGD